MKTPNYPIQITEVPHRGHARVWVLYDALHLQAIIDRDYGAYMEWVEAAGYKDPYDPEAYFEYLRRDLSHLIVNEAEAA